MISRKQSISSANITIPSTHHRKEEMSSDVTNVTRGGVGDVTNVTHPPMVKSGRGAAWGVGATAQPHTTLGIALFGKMVS